MRDLTIQEVIKALPLDEELKTDLMTNYESYPENKKFSVTQILWDAFGEMEDALESYWVEKIMEEIATGKRVVKGQMSEEIHKEVWQNIEDRITGKQEDNQKLDAVRSQLEKLIENE